MDKEKQRKRLTDDQHSGISKHNDSKSKVKAQKFAVDESAQNKSAFVEGSIVRIKLTKFLTYDSVEIKPGPHLNVIIGPNGTGKSAIVCAICLGLAGKTSWLGRATDPRDYIRHGCDKARIEIELFNPLCESNFIITREITMAKISSWWVNGRPSSQKAVEATVARLNIQVGNLCQFLPQEKVADFARMSQTELLENTEKSVGEEGMYEMHQTLKGAREEAKRLETDVTKLMDQLNQEKQRNARLEQDVKSYNDRKNFLAKVEVLKMKKPWLEYQMLKEQHDRAREERDKKTEELKQHQKQLQPLQKKHDQLKVEKDKLENETRDKSQVIRSMAKNFDDHEKNLNNVSDKIQEARAEYDAKVNEEQSRKKRLSDLQDQLKALEAGLAQMDGSDAELILRKLEQTNKDIRNINMELSSVKTEKENLERESRNLKAELRAFENQLKKIKDVNNRRLEALRHLHQHTYDVVIWLRENTHRFKKKVHEPMVVSLNMKNPADAKFIESHISNNDLRAFICEDMSDMNTLIDITKQELKLKVNAVSAGDKHASSFTPTHPISHYKKYGFTRYLQELFTCAEPVLRYLCANYGVHRIPVGTAQVSKNIERVVNECDLTIFYGADEKYTVKKSVYSNNKSTSNSALREPRSLDHSVNADREQELTRSIREQMMSIRNKEDEERLLDKKIQDLTRKDNELREEKRKLNNQKEQRKNLENQITTKRQRIMQVSNESIDLKQEEKKLQAALKKVITEKQKYLVKMKNAANECLSQEELRVKFSFKLEENKRYFSTVEVQLRDAKQRFEGLDREVTNLREHVSTIKQQARDKLTEAKRVAEIGNNDLLEEKLKERGLWDDFNNAPSELEELDGEIHNMQARAESMFQVDEQVIRDYENRKKEIQNLEDSLNNREGRRETHQADVTRLREQWLTPLNDLISRINENFSYFFSSLQCAGEVSLNVPENPEDYEKYGVSIKVKFRDDENLRELTAHHQSGGERSVSTVLYMMALQELTRCPFRCVDEINQGMDPRNERKVFQLVVQTVCKRSASQYFLLTPKLLPDLEYGDHMTLLCVHNGPQMMNHKEWNLKKFIQTREALEE